MSFIYIAVYVVPIFWYPLNRRVALTCTTLEYTVWCAFVADYAIQFFMARDRRHFVRREWLGLIFVIFPFFRPVRAVRGLLFIRQASTRKRSLVRSLPEVLALMAVLLVLIAGAAVLNAERFAPGATITTPSDALWWAISTISTSGSGSLSPVTVEGRVVAGFLLLFGLGLLTSMTGYVASWVLTQFQAVRHETSGPLRVETTADDPVDPVT